MKTTYHMFMSLSTEKISCLYKHGCCCCIQTWRTYESSLWHVHKLFL